MNEYVALFTSVTKLFSEERSRYFKRELFSLLQEKDRLKTAKYPHYNDFAIAEVDNKIKNFIIAYNTEVEGAIDALIKKSVNTNPS